jgi:glucose/arabinose dehydrogenase
VVRLDDLPPPYATRSVSNAPHVVARPPGARLELPPGFRIDPYAEGGFKEPRWLAVAPNGDVFVSDSEAGEVIVLRGVDALGRAKQRSTFATGLRRPFGMAFAPGFLYVGDTDAVVRIAYRTGEMRASAPAVAVAPLPSDGHWTRNLLFSRDMSKLYVAVGSSSNDDVESDAERGTILEMNPDGSGRRIYAGGTRNAIGMRLRPGTDELWAVVQERDGMGDDLVPDFLLLVSEGGFYGWPYSYLGSHEDPRHRGERPDLVAKARTPDLLVQAHLALMDLVFVEGPMFPGAWLGDVIVSEHGSWNRSRRVGYGLARIRMLGGRPAGAYDDFVAGWMIRPESKEVWGRPAGLALAHDGALLIADDGGAMIWRITYTALDRGTARPQEP